MIPLKVFCRHTYGNPSRLGDIGKDIRGVKLTPLGVYVDQKTLVFPGLKDSTQALNDIAPIFQILYVAQCSWYSVGYIGFHKGGILLASSPYTKGVGQTMFSYFFLWRNIFCQRRHGPMAPHNTPLLVLD